MEDVATRGVDINAQVESFLNESTLLEVNQNLNALESPFDLVIGARRQHSEQQRRIAARSSELLKEQLETEKHDQEIKDLEMTLLNNQTTSAHDAKVKHESGKSATRLRNMIANESGQNERQPYTADYSSFISSDESNRSRDALKRENELLRKCLSGGSAKQPNAFRDYMSKDFS